MAWLDHIFYVTWLIHLCVHNSCMRHDRSPSYMWHDAFMYVTGLMHIRVWRHDSCMWHDSFMYVCTRWHLLKMPTNSSYMWHVSCIHVTWHIHVRDMSRAYMCAATSLKNTTGLTHLCVHQVTFAPNVKYSLICVTCLVHTCDVTQYTWHVSFIDVCSDMIHVCDMTHSFKCAPGDIFSKWQRLTHICDISRSYMRRHASYMWHISCIHMCNYMIHVCDMTHPCMCATSDICSKYQRPTLKCIHVWCYACIHVTWLINSSDTWLIHVTGYICGQCHRLVRVFGCTCGQQVYMGVTWFIHERDMTDSFVPWLIHGVAFRVHVWSAGTHGCDMTYSHVCDMTHWYVPRLRPYLDIWLIHGAAFLVRD